MGKKPQNVALSEKLDPLNVEIVEFVDEHGPCSVPDVARATEHSGLTVVTIRNRVYKLVQLGYISDTRIMGRFHMLTAGPLAGEVLA